MASNQSINHHSLAGDNAMTEIALALAMGFFAIMILTLVSMGAGSPAKLETAQQADENTAFIAAALLPTKSQNKSENLDQAKGVSATQDQDRLVIFYNGEFLDQTLAPVDLNVLSAIGQGRVILALDPNLPMSEALDVRNQITAQNLVISALDQAWLDRLAADANPN